MRGLALVPALAALLWGGAAAAGVTPTDQCTPGSMKVILGLCTAEQRAAAKAMNVQPQARAPRKVKAAPGRPAEKPQAPERSVQISFPLSEDTVKALDAWIARQPDGAELNRAAGARRLLEQALPH